MNAELLYDNIFINLKTRIQKIKAGQGYSCYDYGYSAFASQKLCKYMIGNDLMILGALNLSVDTEQEIQLLENLYIKIVHWFIEVVQDVDMAELYTLRCEYGLNGSTITRFKEDVLLKQKFKKIVTTDGDILTSGICRYEVLSYAYRLETWAESLMRITRDQKIEVQPEIIERYSTRMDTELGFLVKLMDNFEKLGNKFYTVSFNICKIIATEYMTAGKKERAFEVLNLALRVSTRYKIIVGREVAGYTDVKRAVKELSKEI